LGSCFLCRAPDMLVNCLWEGMAMAMIPCINATLIPAPVPSNKIMGFLKTRPPLLVASLLFSLSLKKIISFWKGPCCSVTLFSTTLGFLRACLLNLFLKENNHDMLYLIPWLFVSHVFIISVGRYHSTKIMPTTVHCLHVGTREINKNR
jgi:hypothetical protein